MGFVKDIHTIDKQAKEIDRTWHPGEQLREGTATLAALNQQLAQANAALSAPPGDAVDASAQVVSVKMASGMLNESPIIPVELTVVAPGLPPRPVSTMVVAEPTQPSRLVAGATLPVKVSGSNPEALVIDLAAPL